MCHLVFKESLELLRARAGSGEGAAAVDKLLAIGGDSVRIITRHGDDGGGSLLHVSKQGLCCLKFGLDVSKAGSVGG